MKKFLVLLALTAGFSVPASAQTLERIQSTLELKLGYRTDAEPMSFADEDGAPAGYTPLICVQVAQALVNALQLSELDVEFVAVDTANRFEKVASGEIDILCGAASITLGRRELVDFSIPVFVDGTSLLVPANSSDSFVDFAGKKLGVRGDTTTEANLMITLEASEMQAEVIRFVDHAAAMGALENGEINAYFADQSILTTLWRQSPKAADLKLSTDILTLEKQGLAIARGDTEFRLLIDEILSDFYGQGYIQSLFPNFLPGIEPGDAMKAMYMLAPTMR